MSKVKPSPLLTDMVIGAYRIRRCLSAGGFGAVYLAVDEAGQQVAIKEYLPASLVTRGAGEHIAHVAPENLLLYRQGLRNFFEEGRLLAQISHASVVRLLDFFRENETLYMVMSYLEGSTLWNSITAARDLKQGKVLDEPAIRSLFDQVLRSLCVVHQHRMLHLDIKPANIFLTADDRVVLIDFGAAREIPDEESDFIRPICTPGFAAPEMYRHDLPMGPWTDIYAAGACIYACMQGRSPSDALQRIKKDRFASSLSRLRGIYSDNLIEVVQWCMSLDPFSRPQSAFKLLNELSREDEWRYTRCGIGAKLRLLFGNMRSFKTFKKQRPPEICAATTQAA